MIERIKQLVDILTKACEDYYVYDNPTMTDKQYDALYDELSNLEKQTGFILPNSPTQKVQGEVLSGFNKVIHSKPMLSAKKTKDVDEIIDFTKDHKWYCSYKLDGCFTGNTRITMADGTWKYIKDIKVGDLILSCTADGRVVPKRVCNVFNNGLKPQSDWVSIKTEKNLLINSNITSRHSGITCTRNHKFYTPNGYVEAQNLNVGDIIFSPHRTASDIQQSVILGMLLGDGFFVNRHQTHTTILEIHSEKTKADNQDDIIYKISNLFRTFSPKIGEHTSGYSKTKKNITTINLHAINLPNYMGDSKNQLRCGITFTPEVLSHLTPISLAMLFIDDGSLIRGTVDGGNGVNVMSSATIHTNRHPINNLVNFQEYLKNAFDIHTTIYKEKDVKNPDLGDGYVVRISAYDADKFFEVIAPYIPHEYRQRKLPKKYQNVEEINWWENDDSYIGLSEDKIASVVSLSDISARSHSKQAYDIEVEDNHNYFANSHLVHNCTLVIRYENGELIQAITRGNGETGEDVTEQAKMITNLPLHISRTDPLELRGECLISYKQFKRINETLETPYTHPRNLAGGSLRQLDTNITRERGLSYIVFECVSDIGTNSKLESLDILKQLGFTVVPRMPGKGNTVDNCVQKMTPEKFEYPVDGLVFEYDNIMYSKSLGSTDHHERCRIALKWKDDTYETTLRNVEWSVGKTGVVCPVAVFDPVNLDGAMTSRATLHNLSILKSLELGIGDKITVYRANMVIPQIDENLTKSNTLNIPTVCPCCSNPLIVVKSDRAENLVCNNINCGQKRLAKFTHFVERKCANIEGLSEKTLEFLLNNGYIYDFVDIYKLKRFQSELVNITGFGDSSVSKMLDSIDKSRNIKLENYINALGIDGIGLASAKIISDFVNDDCTEFYQKLSEGFDFTVLNGFGKSAQESLMNWYNTENNLIAKDLYKEFKFESNSNNTTDSLKGLRFCITGSFSKSRDEIKDDLESMGAVFVSGISKKLDILFVGENAGSKLSKAKDLGITLCYENELFDKYLKM